MTKFIVGDRVRVVLCPLEINKTVYSSIEPSMGQDWVKSMDTTLGLVGDIVDVDMEQGYAVYFNEEIGEWTYLPEWIELEEENTCAPRGDAVRLLWFVRDVGVDVIGGVDIHQEASILASTFGREEPDDNDYIAAIRTAIDKAMEEG